MSQRRRVRLARFKHAGKIIAKSPLSLLTADFGHNYRLSRSAVAVIHQTLIATIEQLFFIQRIQILKIGQQLRF